MFSYLNNYQLNQDRIDKKYQNRKPQKLHPIILTKYRKLCIVLVVFVTFFFLATGVYRRHKTDKIQLTSSDIAQGVYSKTAYGGDENACILSFVNEEELYKLTTTILDVETRFNHQFKYDWVFISNTPLSNDFRIVVESLTSGQVKFGAIDKKYWKFPEHIDVDLAYERRAQIRSNGVFIGDDKELVLDSFKRRYLSGFLFNHELLKDYDYTMKIEPGSRFTCDIKYDLFKFMRLEKKQVGFIRTPRGKKIKSVETLWSQILKYFEIHKSAINKSNVNFISNNAGVNYNLCQIDTGLEILKLEFFQSEKFQQLFNFLDSTGGFFYELWSDQEIHLVLPSLFMKMNQFYYFGDIGYQNNDLIVCPIEPSLRFNNRCSCDLRKTSSWLAVDCLHYFFMSNNLNRPIGWEKSRLRN